MVPYLPSMRIPTTLKKKHGQSNFVHDPLTSSGQHMRKFNSQNRSDGASISAMNFRKDRDNGNSVLDYQNVEHALGGIPQKQYSFNIEYY